MIQKSIIGDPNENKNLLGDTNFFIFCKPRDIVCGDFLWCRRIGNKQLLIVADSSHNGVPGALITLLGNNALNEIILNNRILEPTKIVDGFLDYFVNESEISNNPKTKNLISKKLLNIGVLSIEEPTNVITYAGLNNTMIQVVPKGNNPDANQIYVFIGDEAVSFKDKTTSFSIKPVKDSMIYLSTNGFEKQLDEKGVRAFKHKKFCDLLMRIAHLEFPDQKTSLEEGLETWKKGQSLTEDILVLGIRL